MNKTFYTIRDYPFFQIRETSTCDEVAGTRRIQNIRHISSLEYSTLSVPSRAYSSSNQFREDDQDKFHHLKATNRKYRVPLQCDQCPVVFTSRDKLLRHRKDVHNDGHQCTQCDKVFSTQGNLNRHRSKHTGEVKYKCTMCDKSFASKANLVGHMNSHTGSKTFQCKGCFRMFQHFQSMSRHRKQCELWAKVWARRAALS